MLPCFSLAAVPGDPPPVVTHGKAVRPFIDTRKALDLAICVLLPAFGIFLHQDNVADKARPVAACCAPARAAKQAAQATRLCFRLGSCVWSSLVRESERR